MSDKVDLFERCAYLDSLLVIRANQEETMAYLDCEPGLAAAAKMVNLFWKDAIDWNETLRIGNHYFNRLVEILEKPDLDQQREDAAALRQELKSLVESAIGIRGAAGGAKRRAITESGSRLLAAIVAEKLMSDIDKYLAFEARAMQRFARLEKTLALAANRTGLVEE